VISLFERFSDPARQVIVRAQEEARMLKHAYIGTEHLLLGLLHDAGTVVELLTAAGVDPVEVRAEVERRAGVGDGAPSAHIPFTARAKKVLEMSLREALQLGHDYIGTEHLLLGMIRDGDGMAAQILTGLGADLNRMRAQVVEAQGHREGGPQLPRVYEDRMASLDTRLASIEERLRRIEDRLPPEDA
jgi:ATP-dependent Clp protease ATP-binding subunit ClpC